MKRGSVRRSAMQTRSGLQKLAALVVMMRTHCLDLCSKTAPMGVQLHGMQLLLHRKPAVTHLSARRGHCDACKLLLAEMLPSQWTKSVPFKRFWIPLQLKQLSLWSPLMVLMVLTGHLSFMLQSSTQTQERSCMSKALRFFQVMIPDLLALILFWPSQQNFLVPLH